MIYTPVIPCLSVFVRESGVFSLSIQPVGTTQAAGFPPKYAAGMTEWRCVQYLVSPMDMEAKF